jgi:hypothetical protein
MSWIRWKSRADVEAADLEAERTGWVRRSGLDESSGFDDGFGEFDLFNEQVDQGGFVKLA